MPEDNDELSWSWNELTGGVRDELTDEEAAAVALFSGIPEDELEEAKAAYERIFGV